MTKFSAKQYAQALLEMYQAAPPADRPRLVKQFVTFVAKRRAWKLVPRLVEHVQQLMDAKAGITRVQVWTAESTISSELEKTLTKSLGQIVIDHRVDRRLIGGARLRIGDQLIDGSLAQQLHRLHTQLTHH